MQNKKSTLLIILGVAAAASLFYGMTSTPGSRQKTQGPQAVPAGEGPSSVQRIVPQKRLAARSSFTSWGRDPFVPKGIKKPAASRPTLDGIMWRKDNPKAIIGGEIVGVGNSVSGYTVTAIEPDSVVLHSGTEEITIELEQ
jgi:hypothetical protein